MAVTIERERPDTSEAMALIAELEEILSAEYEPANRFGYSVDKLIQQGVAFFVIRVDGQPAGCGGIQLYDDDGIYGELKRMYVRPVYRGRGLAKKLLERLAAHARENAVDILRLETGAAQVEAIALYEKYGFRTRGPFGEYGPSDVNIYYEKLIEVSP